MITVSKEEKFVVATVAEDGKVEYLRDLDCSSTYMTESVKNAMVFENIDTANAGKVLLVSRKQNTAVKIFVDRHEVVEFKTNEE